MPSSSYTVVTDNVTVPNSNGPHSFTLAAPAGTKPIAGGWHVTNPDPDDAINVLGVAGSYPDGQDWVFEFQKAVIAGGWNVDIHLVCAVVV